MPKQEGIVAGIFILLKIIFKNLAVIFHLWDACRPSGLLSDMFLCYTYFYLSKLINLHKINHFTTIDKTIQHIFSREDKVKLLSNALSLLNQ